MRRALLGIVLPVFFSTIGFVWVLVLHLFSTGTAVSIYALVLGAIALTALAQVARGSELERPSTFELAQRRVPPTERRPDDLIRLEREVYLGVSNAFYLHVRLRRTLREVADSLLRRRALELDAGGPKVEVLLGPEAWELLRPDRAPPDDREGAGISTPELRRLVEALERI